MVKRWFLVGGILLLVALLMAGCGVAQEQHDAVVAERDSTQAELQSVRSELETVKDELSAAQSTMQAQGQAMAKAKAEAEILSALFVPMLEGEEGEVDPFSFLFEWEGKVEATGDPVLKQKFKALFDSEAGDEEMGDFFLYIFKNIPEILQ